MLIFQSRSLEPSLGLLNLNGLHPNCASMKILTHMDAPLTTTQLWCRDQQPVQSMTPFKINMKATDDRTVTQINIVLIAILDVLSHQMVSTCQHSINIFINSSYIIDHNNRTVLNINVPSTRDSPLHRPHHPFHWLRLNQEKTQSKVFRKASVGR